MKKTVKKLEDIYGSYLSIDFVEDLLRVSQKAVDFWGAIETKCKTWIKENR